ncbi:Hypothetical predicted protein [Olea europaea subsp. europaea]|uniref:Uncharacterized protein n=1 Tax=Olea europaea subsp. europaea TaxID=158383 RepID=A0A8S0PTJ9_OLEEU|nr:Hypothetical predicted protein [Olea europaea subsp. europaea]
MVKRVCRGKISDCLGRAMDEDDQMDSESNRRVLVFQKRYISYDTLKRDTVPCSKPGASYYNCKVASSLGFFTLEDAAIGEFNKLLQKHKVDPRKLSGS